MFASSSYPMEDRAVNHDQEPLGSQEVSMSDMSLTEHLREVQAHEKRQQELRPAPSTSPGPYIDPIFSGSPYNLNDSNKPSEAAKLSARKRDKELSATKRAAQNRAAQRAFRSRKEGHIQELEQQVNRYKALGDAHKMLQIENHQLREYISSLQSLLIDADLDLPHPPPGLDIGMAGHSGEGSAGRTGKTDKEELNTTDLNKNL